MFVWLKCFTGQSKHGNKLKTFKQVGRSANEYNKHRITETQLHTVYTWLRRLFIKKVIT